MNREELSLEGALHDIQLVLDEVRALTARLFKYEELTRSLGDRVLQLSHRVEHNTESDLVLRQKLTELNDKFEYARAGTDEILKQLAVYFARLDKDMSVVEKATREATGSHALVALAREMQEKPAEPVAVKLLDRFARTPKATQVIVGIIIVVLCASGWIVHLLGGSGH